MENDTAITFENDLLSEDYSELSDEARYLLLSNNGTHNFFQFPGSATKYEFNEGTQLLVFSGAFMFFAFALFTLYHAAYYGDNLVTGRKKRSIRDVSGGDPLDFEDVPTDFDALYSLDSNWCALRLACELSARSSKSLSKEERNLMKYFRTVVTQRELRKMPTPELYYGYASYLGFNAGDPSECQDHYSKCPFSSKRMLEIYSGHGSKDHLQTNTKEDIKRKSFKKWSSGAEKYWGGGEEEGGRVGRYLDLSEKTRRKRYEEMMTNYERKRRQDRMKRVKYLLERRKSILERRNNGKEEHTGTEE